MSYKIGAYVRISREEAAQIQEGSISSQKHRIQSFVEIRNAQQSAWGGIVEIYADEGISAKDMNRPAFQRMMRDLRKGKINMLLVTELSRLSRSIKDFCHILEELKKHSGGFLSIKEQFDTSTPAGEMMVFNMINLAQFERKQTAERVSLNFHSRALRGLLNGGQPPLGYDKDPNKKCTYIVNESEAAQARQIFDVYLSNGSLARTITALNEAGIQPKVRGHRNRVWTVDGLSWLLRNRTYIGEREVNRQNKDAAAEDELKPWQRYEIVKASWPGIVEPEKFHEVQIRLNEALKSERARRTGMERRYFWLSGIIRCPECGKPFNGASAHGRNQVYRYYSHQPVKGQPVTCSIRRIPSAEIEDLVEQYLGKVLEKTGALDGVCEKITKTSSGKRTDLVIEREGHDRRKQQIEVEIEKLIGLKLASSEVLVQELFEEKLKNLAQERKVLEQRIQEIDLGLIDLEPAADLKQRLEERIQEFLRGWRKVTGVQKKRMASRVFSRLLPTASGLEVYYLTDESEIWGNESNSGHKKTGDRSVATPKRDWDKSVAGSSIVVVGRGDWIRTSDLLLPKQQS